MDLGYMLLLVIVISIISHYVFRNSKHSDRFFALTVTFNGLLVALTVIPEPNQKRFLYYGLLFIGAIFFYIVSIVYFRVLKMGNSKGLRDKHD